MMCVYVDIIQAHFRQQMPLQEMIEKYSKKLGKYEHHTHDKVIKFKRPADAIYAIIECETIAHKLAKKFIKPN